ncbi:AMP-binding protein [Streptomyces sp. KN37]|uniref:AMP-binding protein n=1 Tax=Streptomyces sp. KN37 TaxID=3090667 RepID=UPI002A758CE4|nr:AMP-binding protein [Streptomyces sp. KN37]WPO75389.1 hypothetical protein R9806_34730 [Streptomyces sp. KN37]
MPRARRIGLGNVRILIWWTLATGGLLVVPAGRPGDRPALARAAEQYDAMPLLVIPSLYGAALRGAGESCPPALVARHPSELPRAALHNGYGPTERTVWATVHACAADATAPTVPIGRPVAGVTAYVVPTGGGPGVPYLAGPGLAEEGGGADRFVTHDGVRRWAACASNAPRSNRPSCPATASPGRASASPARPGRARSAPWSPRPARSTSRGSGRRPLVRHMTHISGTVGVPRSFSDVCT